MSKSWSWSSSFRPMLLSRQKYQRKYVLCTFTSNKSYGYSLNVEPINLVVLKICNTKLDDIIITFIEQNGRSLQAEETAY